MDGPMVYCILGRLISISKSDILVCTRAAVVAFCRHARLCSMLHIILDAHVSTKYFAHVPPVLLSACMHDCVHWEVIYCICIAHHSGRTRLHIVFCTRVTHVALCLLPPASCYSYKVMSAIGVKLCKITPSRGFSIELGAAIVTIIASRAGIPISTTHLQVRAEQHTRDSVQENNVLCARPVEDRWLKVGTI